MNRIALLGLVLGLGGCIDPVAPGSPDAARPDAASPPDGQPPEPACVDDRYGLGTAALPAARLGAGVHEGLQLCAGPDWFALEAAAGNRLQVQIEADRAVAVRLHGVEVIEADGRQIARTLDVPFGGVRLEVVPLAGPTSYRLSLAVLEPVEGCADDAGEPDEGAPTPLGERPRTRALCTGDVDWWRVEAPPGTAVQWVVETVAGAAPTVRVIRGGLPLDEGSGGHFVTSAAPTLLRVSGAEARYRAWATLTPTGGQATTWSGQLWSLDRAQTAQGLAEPEPRLARGLFVDAVDEGGRLLGVAQADAAGRFQLEGWAPVGGVTLRARAAGPGYSVGPEVDDPRPWVFPLEPDGAAWRPRADAALAALHVAEAVGFGLERFATVAADRGPAPAVHVVWRPGGARPCGTCFHPGARPWIDLSGATLDPDEWDDGVILHELGHALAAAYSRDDSPGGRHDGRPVDPRLAWSEGWASFFAGWALGQPELFDQRLNRVSRQSLESPEVTFSGADEAADLSDHLVAGVLWDLWDDADDGEAIALGPGVFPPFFALQAPLEDHGAPGVDLVDYLGLLACTPDPTPAWRATGFPAVVCQKGGPQPAVAEGERGCRWAGGWLSESRRGPADARCSRGRPTR